jgi:glycosyltransferase involved in cell wall biosynthesis
MGLEISSHSALRILMAAGVPRRREAGAAAILYQLADRLRSWGHEVDCLFLEDLGPYEHIPTRFIDATYGFRLARYVRRSGSKYSVVNLHAPWGFAHAMTRRFTSQSETPAYILTLQGAEERYVHAMKREAKKERAPYFRWKNRVWHRAYHMQMYKRAIRGADCAIVANREAAVLLQLQHGLDADRVWLVPNGVDESFFVRRTGTPDGSRLLFVGTWLDRKGIYYLRDAFVRVAAANEKPRLTIAGCVVAETEVRSWFPATLQERIYIRPLVPVPEMPGVYAEHDIFVFPSLMEGMPLSLLEAMASGMTVVTTDTCGMSDIIEDGYNGLLVKPACAETLASALALASGDANLRARLGECARETARRYTWDQVGRKYLSVVQVAATHREPY